MEFGEYRSTPLALTNGQVARPQVDSTGRMLMTTSGSTAAISAPLTAGTDRSGTAGTSSATLAAANTARRGLNIQNISANVLGINEFGTAAAIGTAGTYTVAAGTSINVRTSNAVTVIASVAASPYTATEF